MTQFMTDYPRRLGLDPKRHLHKYTYHHHNHFHPPPQGFRLLQHPVPALLHLSQPPHAPLLSHLFQGLEHAPCQPFPRNLLYYDLTWLQQLAAAEPTFQNEKDLWTELQRLQTFSRGVYVLQAGILPSFAVGISREKVVVSSKSRFQTVELPGKSQQKQFTKGFYEIISDLSFKAPSSATSTNPCDQLNIYCSTTRQACGSGQLAVAVRWQLRVLGAVHVKGGGQSKGAKQRRSDEVVSNHSKEDQHLHMACNPQSPPGDESSTRHSFPCRLVPSVCECNHAIVRCPAVQKIWRAVSSWYNLDVSLLFDLSRHFDGSFLDQSPQKSRKVWHRIVLVTAWAIWRGRNKLAIEKQPWRASSVFSEIQSTIFSLVQQ